MSEDINSRIKKDIIKRLKDNYFNHFFNVEDMPPHLIKHVLVRELAEEADSNDTYNPLDEDQIIELATSIFNDIIRELTDHLDNL